ncbi:unnamed protein product [Calypogeia fissa]
MNVRRQARRGGRGLAAAAGEDSVRPGCKIQDLLPGVLDAITLAKIVTRLSSETWIELGCVNRRWHEALQRQAYKARLRPNHAPEPCVLINHFCAPNG